LDHDRILRAHLAQIAKSVSPIYALTVEVADPEARREAGLLADFVVTEQLPPPKSLDLDADQMRVLRLAVEAAKPDRKCIPYLMERFPVWTAQVSSTARAGFLESLPVLAPAAYDLGDEGMAQVIEAGNVDPALLPCIAEYAMSTADTVRAAARLAQRAASHHRTGLLQTLVDVFPAQKADESREAEKLLPAMRAATEAAGDAAWPAAMELALELTRNDVSSARGTLDSLPGVIRQVPVADLGPYLEDFRMLVEHIGIRVNRICLTELPAWYRRHGSERTRAFVSCACQVAEEYGAVAGQHFLERRTAAAKEMLA
jgi:hypothetical protein